MTKAALRDALLRTEEILESISDAFYAVDHEWRFTYVNRIAEAWWGRSRQDLVGRNYWAEFPQAVGSLPYEAHLTAARERRVIRLEAMSPIVDRWVDISIFPSASGLSVYFRDISERKRAEDRQQLLVNELNHRVKNTIATVQAIAAQTLTRDDVSPSVRDLFTSRLIALASANELLMKTTWRGASLMQIIMHVASPYGGTRSDQFSVEGPDLFVRPSATTALALALHELATNAAKYGALSVPGGRVELRWALVTQDDMQQFHLSWREQGGPPVAKPKRVGFGSRLIQRGLASELRARVRMDYDPSGFVCSVQAPLETMMGAAEPLAAS